MGFPRDGDVLVRQPEWELARQRADPRTHSRCHLPVRCRQVADERLPGIRGRTNPNHDPGEAGVHDTRQLPRRCPGELRASNRRRLSQPQGLHESRKQAKQLPRRIRSLSSRRDHLSARGARSERYTIHDRCVSSGVEGEEVVKDSYAEKGVQMDDATTKPGLACMEARKTDPAITSSI